MRRKAGPVIAALLLIVVIILILVVGKKIEAYIPSEEVQDLQEYFGVVAPEDVAIVWNQELVEEKGKCYDGTVYLDLGMVKDQLNDRFYWDENESLMRYTTADELITVYAGRSEYFIGNDVHKESYEIIKSEQGTIYVAIDFIMKYTDMGYAFCSNPNRILLTTDWEQAKGRTTIKKETQLRVKGGIKSPILAELEKGTEVVVIEPMEEWCKVQTTDGITGYVKNKALAGGGTKG